MDEILYQDDELGMWRGGEPRSQGPALVEADPAGRSNISRRLSGAAPGPSETVTIDRYEPQRVDLTAHLQTPGLVVLADVYYPGWELTVDGVATARAPRQSCHAGGPGSAGTHLLVYNYRPRSVLVGAVLSGIGLVAFMILLVRRRALDTPEPLARVCPRSWSRPARASRSFGSIRKATLKCSAASLVRPARARADARRM